jgi:hypothetical protein
MSKGCRSPDGVAELFVILCKHLPRRYAPRNDELNLYQKDQESTPPGRVTCFYFYCGFSGLLRSFGRKKAAFGRKDSRRLLRLFCRMA